CEYNSVQHSLADKYFLHKSLPGSPIGALEIVPDKCKAACRNGRKHTRDGLRQHFNPLDPFHTPDMQDPKLRIVLQPALLLIRFRKTSYVDGIVNWANFRLRQTVFF